MRLSNKEVKKKYNLSENGKEVSKLYRQAHKEQAKANVEKYYSNPINLAKRNLYLKEYRQRPYVKVKISKATKRFLNTPRGRFKTYESEAKRRGIIFSISYDQFMTYWRISCHYCGDKVETIGLDRVDNSIGYTFANIVPCCTKCNKAKLAMSKDEYIQMCKRVASRFTDIGGM